MSPSSSSSSLAALGPPSPAGPPSAASAVFAAVRKGSVRDLDAAIAALKRGGSGTPSYGASNPTGNGNSSGSSLNFGPGTGGSHTGNQTSSSGCQGGSAAASAGVLLLGAGAGAGSSTASAVDMRNPLGVTPLHVAVWRNHLPCVQRLLDAGADPDIRVRCADPTLRLHDVSRAAIHCALDYARCSSTPGTRREEVGTQPCFCPSKNLG